VVDSVAIGTSRTTRGRQCLQLGLLDEVSLDLVPVLLGGGVSLFEHFEAPILLDGPTLVVHGHRVTHVRYTVCRP
jgi:hypothetical protein